MGQIITGLCPITDIHVQHTRLIASEDAFSSKISDLSNFVASYEYDVNMLYVYVLCIFPALFKNAFKLKDPYNIPSTLHTTAVKVLYENGIAFDYDDCSFQVLSHIF